MKEKAQGISYTVCGALELTICICVRRVCLCVMLSLVFCGCSSGLSDEARADFRVMKDIAVYTRVSPQSRADTLMKFLDRIKK